MQDRFPHATRDLHPAPVRQEFGEIASHRIRRRRLRRTEINEQDAEPAGRIVGERRLRQEGWHYPLGTLAAAASPGASCRANAASKPLMGAACATPAAAIRKP